MVAAAASWRWSLVRVLPAPIPGHVERPGPDVSPGSPGGILVGHVIQRISSECNRPAVGDHPAIEFLAAPKANGDHATVAVDVAMFAADGWPPRTSALLSRPSSTGLSQSSRTLVLPKTSSVLITQMKHGVSPPGRSMGKAGIPKREEPLPRPCNWQDDLRNEANIADDLCAPAPALENDFATMKRLEFRAMTNANDGRLFKLLGQELHQLIFTL